MSVPTGYVEALWVGSSEAELSDGTILLPGVTVVILGEGEAKESDNWRIVPKKKAGS